MKTCEQCAQEKEETQFYRHGNMYRRGERMKICIMCYRANLAESQRKYAEAQARLEAERQAKEQRRAAQQEQRRMEQEQLRIEEEQVYAEAKRQASLRRNDFVPEPGTRQRFLTFLPPDEELPSNNAAYEKYVIDRLTRFYYRWGSSYHARTWLKSLDHSPFVLIDTETTGSNRYSQIIEISILNERGELLYHTLLRPTTPIEPIATSVHGLTVWDVKQSPLFIDVYQELYSHLIGKLVLGYNVSVDIRLLFQTARAFSIPFPLLDVGCLMQCFCKFMGFHPETGRYKTYSLGDACLKMGIDVPVHELDGRKYAVLPHRAGDDALYLWKLLYAMKGTISGLRETEESP